MFLMLVFYVCVFLCAASCVINDDDDKERYDTMCRRCSNMWRNDERYYPGTDNHLTWLLLLPLLYRQSHLARYVSQLLRPTSQVCLEDTGTSTMIMMLICSILNTVLVFCL